MPNLKKLLPREPLSQLTPYLYLLVHGCFLLALMITGPEIFYSIEDYFLIPSFLFLGAAFSRKQSPAAVRKLLLSLSMVVWFLIASQKHDYWGLETRPTWLLSVYLLAYPFAALTGDGENKQGLRLIAGIFLSAAAVLILYAVLLTLDCLPEGLEKSVYWDGARLRDMWHPNIGACIFMIGIAFCLGFATETEKKWQKGLLIGFAAVLFVASGITNSRTSILMTCALVGGFVFFCIFKNNGWKRFLLGAAAALMVMVALFLLAGKAYDWNNDRLIAKYTAQLQAMEEARQDDSGEVSENAPSQETLEAPPVNVNKETGEISLQITNGQGSLAGDLRTLNNRTYIWRAALWLMRENPQFRIWGTGLTKDMVSSYNNFPVGHTHNSWMEVYVSLGIPGLAIALIFTLTAGLDALFLMFHRRTTMQQKVVCLLVICIMGAGFLEPYLFLSDKSYHFIDFLFFLCIGYMTQWREALRKKK